MVLVMDKQVLLMITQVQQELQQLLTKQAIQGFDTFGVNGGNAVEAALDTSYKI